MSKKAKVQLPNGKLHFIAMSSATNCTLQIGLACRPTSTVQRQPEKAITLTYWITGPSIKYTWTFWVPSNCIGRCFSRGPSPMYVKIV
eukprot:scaffold4042_cov165-Amphora_coffeaeformis.AAC.2